MRFREILGVNPRGVVENAQDELAAWAKRQHEESLTYLTGEGWSYGPAFSAEKKTSPRVLPWEDLPNKYRREYSYTRWAAEYQDVIYDRNEPHGGKASEWTWNRVADFPVANLSDILPAGAWEGWMRKEIVNQSRGYYDDLMDGSPIREEIIVVQAQDGTWGIWDGWHRVGASFLMDPPRTTLPAIVGTNRRRRKPVVENARGVGKLPATPENIARAKAFVLRKWKERAVERGQPEPADLSLACKFTSMFAQKVFGGKLRGNYDHQFVVLGGQIIDLNLDAEDVKVLGGKAHRHDAAWFGCPDHKESMASCRPRVDQWVREFRAEMSRPVVENVQDELPPVLYHGTTPYNAALIMLSGQIDENESRDEDDHHDYSVSTTEREEVAAWFYDVARAVDQPFGFVFHIDTSKIAHHMRPFEGETASENEYEWRVYGDIPLSAVTKITLAGYQGTTKSEMRRYVREMESDYRYQHRFDPERIVNAIMALLKNTTLVENARGAGKGLAAMLHRKDAYVSEYENDGFDSEEEASYQFDRLYELFDDLPNPMPIYRGMAVTPDWLNAVARGENPPLGVHWTYDQDAARSDLAGHSHTNYIDPAKRKTMIEVVICGLVTKDAVDWEWTFGKNLPYPDEAEIHVKDASVSVQTIIAQGKTIKIGRVIPTGGIKLGTFTGA